MFKNWERSRLVLRASLSTVVLLLISFLMYPNFLPDQSFAEPGVAANPTIAITPSNAATMTLSPGTFGSVSQTITATTTNYTGYILTMSTSGDSTSLINTENNTLLLPTITLPNGQSSITSANFTANTYGYSLNGTDFKPVPNLNEEHEIISTDSANTSADTRTLTFGALVDLNTVPGTYENTFSFTATANDAGYMISYVANAGSDDVSGMPSPNPEPEPTSGLEVSLSDAVPEREGYRFIGWAETSDATEPDYEPNDTILLDPETSNITTLYAVWKQIYTIVYVGNNADGGDMSMVSHVDVAEGDVIDLYASNFDRTGYGFLGWSFDEDAAETIGTNHEAEIFGPNEEIVAPVYVDNDYSVGDNLIMPLFAVWLESSGNLQEWQGCSSLANGEFIALTDIRDNNAYAITKLSDGNCWIVENMRLNLKEVVITNLNTNNPTYSFAHSFSGASPTSWDDWGGGYDESKYNSNNIDRSQIPTPDTNENYGSWYSYGVYYSRDVNMAGRGGEKQGDLCPTGWRLPTKTEFQAFTNSLDGNTQSEKYNSILSYPNNFVLSGSFGAPHMENDRPWYFYITERGYSAHYAYSTQEDQIAYGYDLGIFSISKKGVGPTMMYDYGAQAVRCIAKEPTTATLSYNASGGEGAPDSVTSSPSIGLHSFTVSSSIPTRSGYSFQGWVDTYGNEAFPGGIYKTSETAASLYAIWTNVSCNPDATTIGTNNSSTDAVCLQDMNATVKNTMVAKQTYNLKDARDNKYYTISLLDDDNVWMTKNLALGTTTADMMLTRNDTDFSTQSIMSLTYNNGNGYRVNSTYGNYYPFGTAIAGSIGDNRVDSICPASWDLPTKTHYEVLANTAGFSTINNPTSSPYSFNSGGGWYNGSSNQNTSNSYYWTSTFLIGYTYSSYAYGVNYNSTDQTFNIVGQTSGTESSVSIKKNIRCIANNGHVTIHYYGNGTSSYPVNNPSSIDRLIEMNSDRIIENNFIRNGYTFDKWNTSADGSGIIVEPGSESAILNGNNSLYAQWLPNYKIIYHSNDSNQSINNDVSAAGKEWTTLNHDAFPSISGKTRIGSWNTQADGNGTSYDINTEYIAPANLLEPTTLNLYAQWIPSYKIIYNGNNADTGNMTSVTYSSVITGETIHLHPSNYSRIGYGFAGWSFNPNATVNGSDIIYGPDDIIEITNSIISNSTNNTLYLYAVWVEPSGTFSDFNPDDYVDNPTGTVLALEDERDGNVYTIAKLIDGNWWMVENMRLVLASAGTNQNGSFIIGAKSIDNNTVNNITVFNTNNPAESFQKAVQFDEDWGLYRDVGHVSTSDTYAIDKIIFGTGNINRDNEPSYYDTWSKTRSPHQDKSWYSYGVMYNWYTATAGNGTASQNSPKGDLCPVGWRLPTGSTNGEASLLKSSALSLVAYPYNFITSGFYYTGPYTNNHNLGTSNYFKASRFRGENGFYWTSTSAGYLNVFPITESPVYINKATGMAVRCIAKQSSEYTLNYNANGGENAPNSQTFTNNTGIIEHIASSIPTRSGYNFSGWADENGIRVSPNGEYIVSGSSATLYALWTNTTCNTNASTIGTGNATTDAVCLQDMNKTIKESMELKTTYTLKDARDDKPYTISLLDDGNVWMTKNLALGNTENTLYSSYDTDIYADTVFILPGSSASFVSDYTTKQMLINETYGNYYSWAAAIADTTAHTTRGENATTSICPSNWNLPNNSQYDSLVSYAGLTTIDLAAQAPYNFVKGGRKNSGTSFNYQGSSIYLWTSTVSNSNSYYDGQYYSFYSNAYQASSWSSNYKYYGESVRCILKNGTITINYYGNGNEDYPVTNSVESQINVEIDSTNARSNSFRRVGYSFGSWNTKADGTGISIPANSNISNYGFSDGDVISLYAQWLPIYTIYYHSNDGLDSSTYNTTIFGTQWRTNNSDMFTSLTGDTKITSWNTMPNGSGVSYAIYTNYDTPPNMIIPETIHLYAQWSSTYSFKYDGNGADDGTMANITHTNAAAGDFIDLYAPNFSKDNHIFAGWSFNPNASINGNDILYGPNERVSITNDILSYNNNGIVTIYAIWIEPTGTIQDFSCSSLEANNIVALRDTRDKSIYTVTKYINEESNYSECWMTNNLALDNTYQENNETVQVIIDSTNTHGVGGVFSTLANPETSNFSSSSTTANSLYNINNITGSNQASRIPRYNNTNTSSQKQNPSITDNRITNSSASTSLNAPIPLYGNYYNWPAAIADTTYYSNYNISITSNSICPRGWHLPSGENGEYRELIEAIKNNDHFPSTFPLNFIKSGYYTSTSTSNRGYYGYYWSSTTYGSNYSYAFNIYPGSKGNLSYSTTYRAYGYSVRCIADDPVTPEQNSDATIPATEPQTDDIILNTDQETEENDDEEVENNPKPESEEIEETESSLPLN